MSILHNNQFLVIEKCKDSALGFFFMIDEEMPQDAKSSGFF
jgi:hypothetical protein